MKSMYHINRIPSAAQARKYLRRIVLGKNVFCPSCGARKVVRYEHRYRCLRCRKKFSLLSHTWLSNMKLSYEKGWMLLWCWTIADPILQTRAITGLSEKTVRHWFGVFRTHLPEEAHILERIVQMEEAYLKECGARDGQTERTRKLAWDVISGTAVRRHHVAYLSLPEGASRLKALDRWRSHLQRHWKVAARRSQQGHPQEI